jgi:hypothetical protein
VTSRGDAVKATRQRQMDTLFKDRRWRVMTEVTEERRTAASDGSGERDRVVLDHGEFWVDAPGIFQTPLGHKGRHGFLLTELDPATGADLDPPVRMTFGHDLLLKAQEEYGQIRDLPVKPRPAAPAAA